MGNGRIHKERPRRALVLKAIPLIALPFGVSELIYRRARAAGEKRGYELRRVKLRMRDGVRLSANLYIPKGNGPFPALVMIHSWALNRWQCHLYAPMFASDGYLVLAYDCRGWGTSG
ncbi:MAG: CocE/NonD family hydrolase, partial [Candidatus Geothermincolales bacterium]